MYLCLHWIQPEGQTKRYRCRARHPRHQIHKATISAFTSDMGKPFPASQSVEVSWREV